MTRIALGVATPAALALAAAWIALPDAAAGPVVDVRARTAITVDPIRRARGVSTFPPMVGLRVNGRIHERGSGEPVPNAMNATITLDDQLPRPLVVDEDGRFQAWLAAERGSHRLTIDFPGNTRFEASQFTLPDLDVAKQPLVLNLRVPNEHRRAKGPLEIEVQATDEREPARVKFSLHVGGAEQEQLPAVGEATTDRFGRAPFALPVERLGAPGPKRLRAVFAGDDLYDSAVVEDTFLVTSATRLTFNPDNSDIEFEGRVLGSGRLLDDLGAPLDGQSISLVADGPGGRRVLDESLTGPDGRFQLDAPAGELGPGRHIVQAVFDSPRPHLEESRSPPARIAVAERRPVPVGYSLAAFAATAASIVVFVALRTRPWTRWLDRLRGESAGKGAAEGEGEAAPHTGLSLARPGLVSTLRRPHDRGFTGRVSDAVTGDPIARAHVELDGVSALTGADGTFAFEELSDGEHRARVSCAGYVTEAFAVTTPHRGELRDTRVDLLPVRERIFQLYREVAEPLLPRPDLWGVWTPRQIFDHVRQSQPVRALAELTDYVEEKYFSSRRPDESELPEAAHKVAAARIESAPPGLGL
jgi:Carboxypeptidase regulatory-like domain